MVYRRFKNEDTFLDWVAKNYEDNDIYAVYLNDDPYDEDSYLCDLRNKEVNMLDKMGYLDFLEDGSPYLSKKEGAYEMVWKNRFVCKFMEEDNS